jgi:hypothetical protein
VSSAVVIHLKSSVKMRIHSSVSGMGKVTVVLVVISEGLCL